MSTLIAKSNFLYYGKGARIYSSAKIINAENIFIDDFAIISDFCFVLAGAYLKLGKYSRLGPYCLISGGGDVHIDNFADLSYGAKIITGSDDLFGNSLITPSVPAEFRKIKTQPVTIGKHAFIGANSIIYPGVTIGEGAIVNPATIVHKSLESWSIHGGPSCAYLGKRQNREEIIAKEFRLLEKK
jgi:acetyltransferase-like isoleucine patch superfamily enzyme